MKNGLFLIFLLSMSMLCAAQILPPQAATTNQGDSNKVFSVVEKEAGFAGGTTAWRDFLVANLNTAIPLKNKAPKGMYKVVIKFIVAKDGSIKDIEPVTNFMFGMEDEVMRVISKSPPWIPALQNGRNVNAYRRQPVTFMVD